MALVIGSTVPTALWPAYEARFEYGTDTTTVLFACYVLALIPATLIGGALSETLGGRAVVSTSVGLAAGADLILSLAPSAPWLAVGRVLQGFGVGGAAAPLTAALLALEPAGSRRAGSLLATVLLTAGAGVGPVLSGVLARNGQLSQPYIASLFLLALTALPALALFPQTPGYKRPHAVRRLLISETAVQRRWLAIPSARSLMVWSIAYASLAVAPSFAMQALHSSNPLVIGAPAGILLLVSAAVQLAAARIETTKATSYGIIVVIAGLITLGGTAVRPTLALLIVVLAVLGAGHGMVFMSALRQASGVATPDGDASTAGAFFAVTYLGGVIAVLGIGTLSARVGLVLALEVFCTVGVLAALALLHPVSPRRRRVVGPGRSRGKCGDGSSWP